MEPMLPELVAAATGRARSAGFDLSCDPSVGGLLAVLAAHLPAGSRILELGTGAGVGTAWIVSGLLPRTDVTVTTVERDPRTAQLAAQGSWPAFTDLRRGDALAVLRESGGFDLIFADAQGGKHEGLDLTIAALNPRGLLIVDDMTPVPHWPAELRARQAEVRRALLASSLLTSVELTCGSGVIVCARRA
jgi:demethylmenaquinone methyltransferase/2-methoxy-6-polyprenyl-1,4-benzoquinol methylase